MTRLRYNRTQIDPLIKGLKLEPIAIMFVENILISEVKTVMGTSERT